MGRPRISTGTSTPNGDTLTLDSHDSLSQTMSFYSNTPAIGDEAQSVVDFDFELLGNNIVGGDGGQSLQTLMASDGSEFTADIDSPIPNPFAEQHLNQSDWADRFDVAAAIPLRVKYLRMLSSLNEDLLQQVYTMNSEDSLDEELDASSPREQHHRNTGPDFQTIFKNSQRFLDIMQPFLLPVESRSGTNIPAASSASTSTAYSRSSLSSPADVCVPPLNLGISASSNGNSASVKPIMEYSLWDPTRKTADDVLRPDFPTAMSFMSCLCSLSRIYRIMISRIERSLLSSLSSNPQLRQLLPSVNLGGFSIEHHHELQIKLLLQVSSDMLERVESTVHRLLVGRDGGGLFPASLFQLLLQQEALEDGSSDVESAAMTLKAKIKNVTRMLEGVKW